MMEIFIYGFLFGGIVVYVVKQPQSDDWYTMHDRLKIERKEHTRELHYYKRLVTELSAENMKFRRQNESTGNSDKPE